MYLGTNMGMYVGTYVDYFNNTVGKFTQHINKQITYKYQSSFTFGRMIIIPINFLFSNFR